MDNRIIIIKSCSTCNHCLKGETYKCSLTGAPIKDISTIPDWCPKETVANYNRRIIEDFLSLREIGGDEEGKNKDYLLINNN